MTSNKITKYPLTELYRVKDTIGVPHPYCITPKHVAYASDHCSGMLGVDAIRGAEKHGAVCDTCKQIGKQHGTPYLKYDEHKQALLVEVKFKGELKDAPGLQEYLLSCKEMCEADGFVGFAFIKGDYHSP